jgi:hypothetical protein
MRAQLEVFDWLRGRKDRRVSVNPAGFLVDSIKSEYAPPSGFLTSAEKARLDVEAAAQMHKREARKLVQMEQERTLEQAIDDFWNNLSEVERTRHQEGALQQASPFDRNLMEGGGMLGRAARQRVLDTFARRALQKVG